MTKEKFNPEHYTKYEKARILGARALQISANAPILLKIEKEELEELNYDPIKIAELEFEAGILPITVKRPLPKKVKRKIKMLREEEKSVEKEPEPEKEPEKKKEKIETELPEVAGAEIPEAKSEEKEEGETTEEAIVKKIEKTITETEG